MATIDELKGAASAKLGFARANNFLVELPSVSGGGFLGGILSSFIPSVPGVFTPPTSGSEINLLCKSVQLPGRQITTHQRAIGAINEKVAYGYAVDDVSISFHLLNDYGMKNYFDKWMSSIVNPETNEIGYKNNYAKSVKIHQLRKPLINKSTSLGVANISIGIGGGSVYTVELLEAFPTTVNAISFSDELDGLIEVNVQLSYTNWKVVAPSQQFINIGVSPGQIF